MRSVIFISICVIADAFQTSEMGNGFDYAVALFFVIFLCMDIFLKSNDDAS